MVVGNARNDIIATATRMVCRACSRHHHCWVSRKAHAALLHQAVACTRSASRRSCSYNTQLTRKRIGVAAVADHVSDIRGHGPRRGGRRSALRSARNAGERGRFAQSTPEPALLNSAMAPCRRLGACCTEPIPAPLPAPAPVTVPVLVPVLIPVPLPCVLPCVRVYPARLVRCAVPVRTVGLPVCPRRARATWRSRRLRLRPRPRVPP